MSSPRSSWISKKRKSNKLVPKLTRILTLAPKQLPQRPPMELRRPECPLEGPRGLR
jgi:hypothetical protein